MPGGEKVLVIDDHPVVLDGVTLSISELIEDAHILTALNGDQAREVVKRNRDIDWILIDVNLPDIDGIQLLKEFESMKVTANIIVLSSDSNPSIIDRALKQHASGFLSKSYDRKELQNCLVESTVKSHVHALMVLFDADNRTHCAVEARRLHIIV